MRKNIEFSKEEEKELLNSFYNYFEDGFKFEKFLKIYLEKLGLEEVYVTRSTGDGGIDLTAIRKGIGEFSQSVDEQYYIQAKRYSPESTISPEKIRALRGSFSSGKGLFITTGKVSKKAKEDALNIDQSRPIIVIDGSELLASCVDMELGFSFKPCFSSVALDDLMTSHDEIVTSREEQYVERIITQNDIRAYILPIPRVIRERIPGKQNKVFVSFNDDSFKEYSIDAGHRYIAGISSIYRENGLRQSDGTLHSKKSLWTIDDDLKIRIKIIEL